MNKQELKQQIDKMEQYVDKAGYADWENLPVNDNTFYNMYQNGDEYLSLVAVPVWYKTGTKDQRMMDYPDLKSVPLKVTCQYLNGYDCKFYNVDTELNSILEINEKMHHTIGKSSNGNNSIEVIM